MTLTMSLPRPHKSARKIAKIAVLHAARTLGFFAVSRLLSRRAIRILCYHGIWLGDRSFQGDSMFMRAETFSQRMAALERQGYQVVSLSDAVDGLTGKTEIRRDSVVITIDDGWYSTYCAMLPELKARGYPATLYCDTAHVLAGTAVPNVMAEYLLQLAGRSATDPECEPTYLCATNLTKPQDERLRSSTELGTLLNINVEHYHESRVFHYMTPNELREAHALGIDVQLHTHDHDLGDMSAATVRRTIAKNREALSHILGLPPERFEHFCYPSGLFSSRAWNPLRDQNIVSATTLEPGVATQRSALYELPRFCDGEGVSPIEFEAELSGFATLARTVKRTLGRLVSRPKIIPKDTNRRQLWSVS